MEQEKIISICIPTYNGAKTLRATLDSIVPQINNIDENERWRLEIVLTDDVSIDETLEILKEYAAQYQFVKYFVNEKNLGMDGNFRKSALNAVGKYIWYSGQDDIFLDGVINRVMEALVVDPEISIIYINYSQYSEKDKAIICDSMFHQQAYSPEKIDFDKDIFFRNAKEYFEFFDDAPSFLPATVMKREFWLTTETEKYLGTHYIQYATTLLNMSNAHICAITEPLIRGMIPQSGWQKNGDKLFSTLVGHMKAKVMIYEDKNNSLPRKIFLEKRRIFLKNFLHLAMASKFYGHQTKLKDKNDLKFIFPGPVYYFYILPILFLANIMPIKILGFFKK